MAQENGHRVFLTMKEISALRILNSLGSKIVSKLHKDQPYNQDAIFLVNYAELLEQKLSDLVGEKPMDLSKYELKGK